MVDRYDPRLLDPNWRRQQRIQRALNRVYGGSAYQWRLFKQYTRDQVESGRLAFIQMVLKERGLNKDISSLIIDRLMDSEFHEKYGSNPNAN